tara:strand:- start:7072 stop:7668 length:597 start_codon:yes stop_codon:yes gene_type:complete
MPPSKRDDLIDAAMRVFYRSGFHNSSLDDIQEEGGISRMTLYNHFKSKDELMVAAMRRRDEIFRNRMMKFAESKGATPRAHIEGVFDFHEDWFTGDDFHGCMFINASAEFSIADSAPRRIAAEHKQEIVRYLIKLLEADGCPAPHDLADQLNILIEGAIVTARVVGQVVENGTDPGAPARLAKRMAINLLDQHGSRAS